MPSVIVISLAMAVTPAYADGNASTSISGAASTSISGGGGGSSYSCGGADGLGAATGSGKTLALDTSYVDPYNASTTDAPFSLCTWDIWNNHQAQGGLTWCPAGFDQWNFYSSSNTPGASTFYTVSRIRVKNDCAPGVASAGRATAPSYTDSTAGAGLAAGARAASGIMVTPSNIAGGYEFPQPTVHVNVNRKCSVAAAIYGTANPVKYQSYCGQRTYLSNVKPYKSTYVADATFAQATVPGTGTTASSCQALENSNAINPQSSPYPSSNAYVAFNDMNNSSLDPDPTMASATSAVRDSGYWRIAEMFWANYTADLASSGQNYAYADRVNNVNPAVGASTLGLSGQTVTAATFKGNVVTDGTKPTSLVWPALANYFGNNVPPCSSYAQFMPDTPATGGLAASAIPYLGTCIIPIQRQAHVWYSSTANMYEANYTNPLTSQYAAPAGGPGLTGGVAGPLSNPPAGTWRGMIESEVAHRASTYYRIGVKFTNTAKMGAFAAANAHCAPATAAGLALPVDATTNTQTAVLGAPTFKAAGEQLPQLATIATGAWSCTNCNNYYLANLRYDVTLNVVNGGSNPNLLRGLNPNSGWQNCTAFAWSSSCLLTLQDDTSSGTCSSTSCSLAGIRNYVVMPDAIADNSHNTYSYILNFAPQSGAPAYCLPNNGGCKPSNLTQANLAGTLFGVGKPRS